MTSTARIFISLGLVNGGPLRQRDRVDLHCFPTLGFHFSIHSQHAGTIMLLGNDVGVVNALEIIPSYPHHPIQFPRRTTGY